MDWSADVAVNSHHSHSEPERFATEPRPSHVWVGGHQFALALIRNCFEDAIGRGSDTHGNDRRLRAAHALRWLRQAGKLDPVRRRKALPVDLREDLIGSLDWCASILNVDPVRIARDGVHCVPGSGLKNW